MDLNGQNISNLSYTSKDFESIYPELLELVQTLTSKWDPTTSNESDPGVILLKLMSLMADKNDYNIDKNILECFPVSVTQQANARRIYDLLGYSMHWYRSASTNVTISLSTNLNKDDHKVIIPRGTELTNDSGDIIYTLTNNVELNNINASVVAECLQGVYTPYTLNGVDTITLANLDDNNRVYFPDRQVAENGIFISVIDQPDELWESVSNLEIQPVGSKVFKFGVMVNSDTCYIQFPSDIGTLIGGGLKIYYLISQGVDGNVNQGSIVNFYSDAPISTSVNSGEESQSLIPGTDIRLRNSSSATNGTNPESLESAYHNYKKTIGTFDTLVTLRDYENYIYNLYNESNNEHEVSNSIVTDRANDINFSTKVQVLTANGEELINAATPNSTGTVLSAFDLVLRLLTYSKNIIDDASYNATFSVSPNFNIVVDELSDAKSIQHDFPDPVVLMGEELPFIFKNFLNLTGKIITHYKVSNTEASSIEANVKNALYTAYNARSLDFGEEITYEHLVETIKNADTRIKNVILGDLNYESMYTTMTDSTGDYQTSLPINNLRDSLLAKMVLAGNVPLFELDTDFDFDFNQQGTIVYSSIPAIKTNPGALKLTPGQDYYTVQPNESVSFYAPTFYTSTSYGAYVYYKWSGVPTDGHSDEDIFIAANEEHLLVESEKLTLNYTDTGNVSKNPDYSKGTIIKPNFNITYKDVKSSTAVLDSSQTIEIRAINTSELTNNVLQCAWITNKKDKQGNYILFEPGEASRVLQNNEFFMYTLNAGTEFYMVGSGTRISLVQAQKSGGFKQLSNDQQIFTIKHALDADLEAINKDGLNGVGNEWYNYYANSFSNYSPYPSGVTPPTGNVYIAVTEMQVITLGEGIKYKLQENTPVSYTESDTSTDFTKLPLINTTLYGQNISWQLRRTLNLNVTANNPQYLAEGQSIELLYEDSEPAIIQGSMEGDVYKGVYVNFNVPLQRGGTGKNEVIDLGVSYADGTVKNEVSAISFSSNGNPNIRSGNYINITCAAFNASQSEWKEKLKLTLLPNKTYLIPIIYNTANNVPIVFDSNFHRYNAGGTSRRDIIPVEPSTGAVELTDSEVIYLVARVNETDLPAPPLTVPLISLWNGEGESADLGSAYSILIGEVLVIEGFSKQVLDSLQDEENDVNLWSFFKDYPEFNVAYKPLAVDLIDYELYNSGDKADLFSPRALWDPNHICSAYTIAQLNTLTYDVKVSSSSKSGKQ